MQPAAEHPVAQAPASPERFWVRILLRAFPPDFRTTMGPELLALCRTMDRAAYAHRRRRLAWDLIRGGIGVRLDSWRARRGRASSGYRRAPVPPSPHRSRPVGDLLEDLRYGLRVLLKNPGFSTIAIASLALGIGANTAIFSVVNAAVIRRLPVPDPSELVALHWLAPRVSMLDLSIDGWMIRNSSGRSESSSFSNAFLESLHDNPGPLSHVFGFADLYQVNVRYSGSAELAGGQVVSGDYFAGLGVEPLIGRLIGPGDDASTAPPVVVVTYGYWQRRFAGDLQALGQVIYVNGAPFTVIGVTPPGFQGALQVGSSPDVSLPLAHQAAVMGGRDRLAQGNYWWLHLMGRMRSGVTRAQVQAAVEPLYRADVTAGLDGITEEAMPDLRVLGGSRGMTERRREMMEPLGALVAVVALVLLIACANLANLLLARASARRREIAVRLSLGASRWRLVRQLLTESVLLALTGGLVGLGVAVWARGLLVGVADLGELSLDLSLDRGVLLFTLALSLITGVLFGLAPALRASRVDLAPALKSELTYRSHAGVLGGLRLSRAMMALQVGLSTLLLVMAGLFVRTLGNLQRSDQGYNADNVLLLSLDPTLNQYEPEAMVRLYDGATEQLAAIPGVLTAAVASRPPLSGGLTSYGVYLADEPSRERGYPTVMNFVGPGFFRAFEIPLLAGRRIESGDVDGSPMVAVVNERFARAHFPDANPIGRHFGFDQESSGEYEIVGIVGDVAYQDLRDHEREVVHVAYAQHGSSLRRMRLIVRVAADPMSIAPQARDVIRRLDSDLPVFGVRTQSAQRNLILAQESNFARASSVLGGLALLLACIGLYGILSYTVLRRTREIGVRIALGARAVDLLRLVAHELGPVLGGIILGLGVAWLTTGWLQSLLFGVEPMDPASVALAAGMLTLVAGIAAWLPARRAARVDPVIALRAE